MPEIVQQFLVTYSGKDADNHTLEATALGESITGASKLYTAVAHYSVFGIVPRRRYRKSFACYARPSVPRSWDQLWFVAPLAGEYGIHAQIYNQAISYIFKMVIGYVKSIWTKPSETSNVVDKLTDTFLEKARLDNNVMLALVNGLVQSNDGFASLLHERLNET